MTEAQIPQRFQVRRTKGWRKPENAVYVGRPTRWGNPFPIDERTTRDESVRMFEEHLKAMPESRRGEFLKPLRGKNLLCWCPRDLPCHADVLLKWANRRS